MRSLNTEKLLKSNLSDLTTVVCVIDSLYIPDYKWCIFVYELIEQGEENMVKKIKLSFRK